jgi:sigma-B regulation protein RsbU (phosphoserine phosphatase)
MPELTPLELLANVTDYEVYQAGGVVVSEGEPGDRMFLLVEGELAVTIEGRPIDRLWPGSIFGEMALVDTRPRSATVTAATDSKLIVIDRERFADLVRETPAFGLQVMGIMSSRLRRLMDDEVKRLRMEEEMAIGRRIQRSLLPASCPQIPGWEFAAYYRAARQVGGDLYDFIALPETPELLHLVIADVTGKGVPAALFMAFGRTVIRTEARNRCPPVETLRRTNHSILQDIRTPLFLSAFYATLETESGRLVFANAGHNWPYLRRRSGAVQPLASKGLLLGVFPEAVIEEQTTVLEPGDCLVLYTDGITEADNAAGDLFEEERLEAVIASRAWESADDLLQAIVAAVEEFTGDTPQADDFTLVVARREEG